jgi:redox-sensitive bicupin YhaK (pirin superfamily)
MSIFEAPQSACDQVDGCDPVVVVITPKAKDIGAFEVRRTLPSIERRSVGPFVFFDEMGPAELADGNYLDVRPHPHIGLSTITWLLEGEIMHRDSLGYVQPIRPGEVNWMTAGSGIVHSERTPEELRVPGSPVHGIQTWVALPKDMEECDPAFVHYAADAIPRVEDDGAIIRVIIGAAWGARSPVETPSETLYADISLSDGASVTLPGETVEKAVYILSGAIEIAGTRFESGRMAVLRDGAEVAVSAVGDTRIMLCGGAPLDGPRHMLWNFVSSSKERIERAKDDWKAGRFTPVPDDDEFIPLP